MRKGAVMLVCVCGSRLGPWFDFSSGRVMRTAHPHDDRRKIIRRLGYMRCSRATQIPDDEPGYREQYARAISPCSQERYQWPETKNRHKSLAQALENAERNCFWVIGSKCVQPPWADGNETQG